MAARRAVADATPHLIPLLTDADVGVRRMIPYTLATCADHTAEVVQALQARQPDEPDLAAQASIILAVGFLASHRPDDVDSAGVQGWLTQLLDADAEIRLAAAVAWATMVGDELANSVLEAITSAATAHTAAVYEDVPWLIGDSPDLAGWVARSIGLRPATRNALVHRLARAPEAIVRTWAVQAAGEVMLCWRSPTSRLVTLLARLVRDQDLQVRLHALRWLGQAGQTAATVADALTDVLTDGAPEEQALAAVALAHCGDPRCLPSLCARLEAPDASADLPALRLASLRTYAPELLPTLRRLLRTPPATWRSSITLTGIVGQLSEWGEAITPAVAELITLLEGDPDAFERVCSVALGRIGPPAAAAVPILRRLVDQPAPHPPVQAAWALWRITGDPHPTLDVLGTALARGGVHASHAAKWLADLGPAAVTLQGRLRQLLDDRYEWVRVEAAHALWRATGDEQAALGVLTAEITHITSAEQLRPVDVSVISYLGEIGPPARAALPALRAIRDSDRRANLGLSEKTAIPADEHCQQLVRTAIRQIRQSPS
jgi:hypothetical protein